MALTKIDDRGLNTPIDLLDDEKIRFGTGNDLEIYHDGTNSFVASSQGELRLYGTNGTIRIRPTNTEDSIVASPNGAVELYFNGSPKLQTISAGVSISGELQVEDVEGTTLRLGNTAAAASDGDYLSGIDFHIKDNNDATGAVCAAIRSHADQNHTASAKGTALTFHTTDDDTTTLDERFRITHDGKVGLGVTGPSSPLHVKGIDTTIGVHTYPQLTLETESTDGAADKGSGIMFLNHDGNGGKFGGGIRVLNENATVLNHASYMSFTTRPAGGSVTEALRIASTGEVSVQVGNLKLPNGQGIDFSANANATGNTSNNLDDYESGTWTASMVTGTCSDSSCKYIKIGNQVTVWGRIHNFSDTSTNIILKIQGLPYACNISNAGGNSFQKHISTEANCPYVTTDETISFYGHNTADAWQYVTHLSCGSGSYIYFYATYRSEYPGSN